MPQQKSVFQEQVMSEKHLARRNAHRALPHQNPDLLSNSWRIYKVWIYDHLTSFGRLQETCAQRWHEALKSPEVLTMHTHPNMPAFTDRKICDVQLHCTQCYGRPSFFGELCQLAGHLMAQIPTRIWKVWLLLFQHTRHVLQHAQFFFSTQASD